MKILVSFIISWNVLDVFQRHPDMEWLLFLYNISIEYKQNKNISIIMPLKMAKELTECFLGNN